MLNRLVYILLFLLFGLWAVAEETYVVGEVLNELTGEPVPNASVYFRGSKVGTTTDDNGSFFLHVDLSAKMTLVVSSIGYKSEKFTILPGQSAGIEVMLREKSNALEELVVLPGANPALPLMDSVRAHKAENNLLPSAGNRVEQYYLSNITARHLRRRVWRSLQSGMVQLADSSYLLPVPAELASGMMDRMPEHLNFYASTIPFHSVSFLSPLAGSAEAYYHFFLVDSLPSPKRYVVDFLPKNSFDALFKGTLHIDSATYALTSVKASVPTEANINFLSALHYAATYREAALVSEQVSAVMDIAVRSDSSHVFPSLMGCRTWQAVGEELRTTRPSSGMVAQQPIVALPNIDGSSASTLVPSEAMPDAVEPTDMTTVAMLPPSDSVADLPLLRFAKWLATTIHTGYMPTGTCIDVGNIVEILSYNRYEHLHLGLPFRTNEQLFPHVSLEGYLAYGFRDQGIKYKLQAQVVLPTTRRNIIGAYWWDHYVYAEVSAFDQLMRENSIGYGNMRFTTYLLQDIFYKNSTAVPSAVRKQEMKIWTENDWLSSEGDRPSVETRFALNLGKMGYGNPCLYHYYDMPSFSFTSFSGVVRLGWHERVADIYLTRKHLYSTYPTLFAGVELGSWRMPGEAHYHVYGALNLMLRQEASLGMGGVLSYTLQAGVTLGRVPYSLLNIMDGNQSYSFAPQRFTLMNNNCYAVDKYLLLHANWNGRGILFNRIPGIRYLRLRELVEMKLAYGGLSDANKHIPSLYPELAPCYASLQSLSVPYVEVGVGIGNILRVCDVYSVWKLTHRDDPSTPRWGVRFCFNFGL